MARRKTTSRIRKLTAKEARDDGERLRVRSETADREDAEFFARQIRELSAADQPDDVV